VLEDWVVLEKAVECCFVIRLYPNLQPLPIRWRAKCCDGGGCQKRKSGPTIQLLLERGADVDALDDAQSTPLHVASEYGSAKATRLLLEHGANVHLQNNEGHAPSQVASAKGHEEIARLLSEHSQIEKKM
jgi:hypothetical protein